MAIHVGSVGKSTGNDRVIVASDNDLFEYCDNHITVDTSDTSKIKGKALRHHPSTDLREREREKEREREREREQIARVILGTFTFV